MLGLRARGTKQKAVLVTDGRNHHISERQTIRTPPHHVVLYGQQNLCSLTCNFTRRTIQGKMTLER